MKKGLVFDLHREGLPTVRVMALGSNRAIGLDALALDEVRVYEDVDVDNEMGDVFVSDVMSESKTELNMKIINSFMGHHKSETGKDIPEDIFLSFFNA